ncbi:septum formation family protein [Phytoactinopolyspora limicola]|uniref:septum formation family protein n=1 Tax=Phytoactinopolyspora limicola TaxID=2715536 RepID=UPI00140BD8F1|nr:septum formation family protein [Phytoactinopolyspora limicola]
MTRTTRISGAIRVAAIVGASALVLTGCSVFDDLFGGDDEPDRNDDGQVSDVVENASIFDITEGDCLGEYADDGDVKVVDIIPCDQEHFQEVLLITQIDAEELPDQEEVRAQVIDECPPAFEEFVGLDFDESELDIHYLSPSSDSWEQQDDRDIVCTVYDPSGMVTGSFRGAER